MSKFLSLGGFLFLSAFTRANDTQATSLVRQALAAMGGEERVASISSIKYTSVGHSFAIEQSERPEGPWYVVYSTTEEQIDFAKMTLSVKGHSSGLLFPDGDDFQATTSFENPAAPKRDGFAYPYVNRNPGERLALGPERVLFAALQAKDLHVEKDVPFHGGSYQVVAFNWGANPVRILLNPYNHLPGAVEVKAIEQGYLGVWGQITTRLIWGNWDLAKGGIVYPTLWTYERNGLFAESYSLSKVAVSFGNSQGAAVIGDQANKLASSISPDKAAPYKVVELAPGIVQFQGGFNCAAIDQGDGIVILEGTTSSAFMEAILDEVTKRFHGKKIKCVVSTDDAWPHIAGLRVFAARGIPIFLMSLNKPIVERLSKADFSIRPDALEKNHLAPVLKTVDSKTTIGSGINALELYPMHGSVTERMIYGYFPNLRLLFAPDVIQHQGDQWFGQNLLAEMQNALERDGVHAEKAFAMHSGLIDTKELWDAVAKAK